MNGKPLLAGLALVALAACGDRSLTAYESEPIAACASDPLRNGEWAGETRARRHVEDGFEAFERQFGWFLDNVEHAAREAVHAPKEEWASAFEPLHAQAGERIADLGRLLPRINRPLDLPPMVEQLERGTVWWPGGNHHTEYLGVALAEEFVAHGDLGARLAGFLSAMEAVEARLLALKYPEVDAVDADGQDAARLVGEVHALHERWNAVRPGMREVLFEQPDALSRRLAGRVKRYCDALLACAGTEGACGADNVLGASMDAHDPLLEQPMAEEP